MTVREPRRVARFIQRHVEHYASSPWAPEPDSFELGSAYSIEHEFADDPIQRDRLLAIYDDWMRPRLPHIARLEELRATARAGRANYVAAKRNLEGAAKALLVIPAPDASALAVKHRINGELRPNHPDIAELAGRAMHDDLLVIGGAE